MALETGNYIDDLVITNPTGADGANTSDDHHRLIKTALKTSINGFTGSVVVTGTDAGAADAAVLTLSPALPGYTAGLTVLLLPVGDNTGAATLNINSLGAKAIQHVDGSALLAGDLKTGKYSILIYDGTQFQLVAGEGMLSNVGNQTLTGNFTLTGDQTVSGTLGVTGLITGGNATLSGTLNVASTLDVGGTADIVGATTLSDTLDVTGVTTLTAQPILSSLTASLPVFSDGSKGLVSNAVTGSGNVVMSASPALTGTPTAPTATLGTTTTQVASTEFVANTSFSSQLPAQGGATAGDALTTDGAGVASWNSVDLVTDLTPQLGGNLDLNGFTIAGAAGLELLQTSTASASSTVDLETTLDSTYDSYIIHLINVIMSVDANTLLCRMKIGTYLSDSTYKFHVSEVKSSSAAYAADVSAGGTSIQVAKGLGTGTGENLSGTIYVADPTNTGVAHTITSHMSALNSDGVYSAQVGGGLNTTTGALTGIRFLPGGAGGTIASGTFKLYGCKKTI